MLNMKNTKMSKITTMSLLVMTLFAMGACKKTVYNTTNQVFSATYKIEPADWKADTRNPKVNYFVANLPVPEVDDIVVGDGGVVVYLSFDGGTTFDALPEEVLGITYNAYHSKGIVTIGYGSLDVSQPPLPANEILAKVVILDGQPLD